MLIPDPNPNCHFTPSIKKLIWNHKMFLIIRTAPKTLTNEHQLIPLGDFRIDSMLLVVLKSPPPPRHHCLEVLTSR